MSREKPKSRLNIFASPGSLRPTLVPPVLKEVGKLAAGVASVSTNMSSGSATGNPRNKVALQPGHSLMDWIRLGSSGKDLAGFGSKSGTLSITKQELSKHSSKNDAWLAIRGKVYNITEYFPFHPGGEDELMKGAGIDATILFENVHPWVNYEQILHKCLIGKLVSVDPNVVEEDLFTVSNVSRPEPKEPSKELPSLPRFDWIQKLEYISTIFYTKPFSNPLVEIHPPVDELTVKINLSYLNQTYTNDLAFFDRVKWPCDVNVTQETGKVEISFKKSCSGIWDNYGVLKQQTTTAENRRVPFTVKNKTQITHNIFLLKLERQDGRKIVLPVGKHVRLFAAINGDISRSYTPVPENLFGQFLPFGEAHDGMCLMMKRYEDGKMSRILTDLEIGQSIETSTPFGAFHLKSIEKKENFLMIAAGTGVTPIFGLIMFLLERRIKKCQFVHLLFFNRAEQDIPFKNRLNELALQDKRFKVDHILSEPAKNWTGYQGRVNAKLIEDSVQEHLRDTGYTIKDIYCFVCGPPKFDDVTLQELNKINITEEQIHLFEG